MGTLSAALLFGAALTQQMPNLDHVATWSVGLDSPARVAVTADTLLVTDPRSDRIQRYDMDGASLGTWSEPTGPVGVAVHTDGRIFVSRRDDHRVGVYDAAFTFQRFLADGVVSFVEPTDVAVDTSSGWVYVVDSGADRVYGFASDESVALILGARGAGLGQFRRPSAIALDPPRGRILVADQDNFRVQVLTTSGTFLFKFGYRIKYLPNGDSVGWFPRTAGLAVDSIGRIYVTDGLMGTLRAFTSAGVELGLVASYGSEAGDLQNPGGLALGSNGLVFVANSNRGAIEVFGPGMDPAIGPEGERPGHDPVDRRALDIAGGTLLRRAFGASGRVWFWPDPEGGPAGSTWEPPHMRDDVTCGRCHGIDGQPGGHEGTVIGQANLCLSCHTGAGQALALAFRTSDAADPFAANPGAPDGLGTSHAWGVPAVSALADSVGPLAGSPMALHLSAGQIKCATCHNAHNSVAGAPFLRVSNDGDSMCKQCHAPRDRGPGEGGSHAVGFTYPGESGEFPAEAALSPLELRDGNVECTSCHAVHAASSGGANDGAGDGMLLRAANNESLCRTCHTQHTLHTPAGDWQPTCGDCHAVHDPENPNLSLVSRVVHNQSLGSDRAVVFTAREGANSFDDGDPTANNGICQVCHTTTAYHRHDGSGAPHHNGAVCTDCHTHGGGFLPSGGGSCIECHSNAQGNRRPVVNEFGLSSHHVQGAVTNADCVACHDQSQHRLGTVRLKNADDPSIIVALTGNPLTTPAVAAQLEPFCLSCHDSDGAGGSPPFADGIIPPAIDAAPWSAASHSTGPTTCVGDGETFGCHSTGHGSMKNRLLAPWDALQPPVAGDPLRQEEGSCYACHDASGPAQTNIQSLFALLTRHDVSSLDQASGSRVECLNCHDPHKASAANPLINPDSGAMWDGGTDAFCLTCHDGAPPAGVLFPVAAPGSGYDKSAYPGSTHAMELGTDGCVQCHNPHGSANIATLHNRYVVADFNQYSTGDGDYAACWACHNENAIIEQDNHFEEHHKKHVREEDAPCIACHNAHQPFDAGEPGLIDLSYPAAHGFNFSFISSSNPSTAFWLNANQTQGNCLLRCHGENHNPENYNR